MFSSISTFISELGGDTLVKIGVALATILYAALELTTSVSFALNGLTAAMGV